MYKLTGGATVHVARTHDATVHVLYRPALYPEPMTLDA